MSQRPAASAERRWRSAAWPLVGLGLALLLAYSNAFRVPFVFDDEPAIARAAKMVGGGGVLTALRVGPDAGETTSGRPLLAATLALNYAVGRENPGGYHALNLLIHAGAALLGFGIVRRMLLYRQNPTTSATGVAFAVATIWALHPLQTQAVTYTVQRAESLAGMLVLLTVYTFLRAAERVGQVSDLPARRVTDPPYSGRWLALSVVACALAMATKEVAVGAPLIVLLMDRTFVAGSVRAAWHRRRGYYVALASTWIVLGALVLGTKGRGGTAGFDAGISAWHYLLTQCQAVAGYLGLVAWPEPLIFDYGTDVIRDVSTVILPGMVLVALVAVTGWGLWRKTWWGLGGAFFFITLAPSSSFVPIASQTIAEHRVYLATLGPLTLAVIALRAALGRRCLVPLGLTAVACGWLTHARNDTYRTELALWSDTVAKRPQNDRAHHNLGLAELKRDRVEIAAAHFEAALRLRPDAANSHYNLALCLARLGRATDAVRHYERALAERPAHAQAHNNLGLLLLGLERAAQARVHLEHAVRLRPDLAEAHSNLADALLRAGEAARALQSANEALKLRPDFAEAYVHAGNAAASLQRFADARAHFEAALRLEPANATARNNLANVLLESGQLREAVPHLERVLQIERGHVQARRNLAICLIQLQRPADAVPHLEELARALPGDPQVAEVLREAKAAARR